MTVCTNFNSPLEAMIRFEEDEYVTSESDGSVDVCVTASNGNVVSDLTVSIDLLPSTAIGNVYINIKGDVTEYKKW